VEAKFFRTRPDRPWGPPSLLYDGYRVFPRIKRPGRGVNHPHLSRVQVKERVEVYCYAPSGPSWPVLGWNLPFTFTFTVFGLTLLSWQGVAGIREEHGVHLKNIL